MMRKLFIQLIKGALTVTLTLTMFTVTVTAAAGEFYEHILNRAQWPAYTNGTNVAALPAVGEALRRFDEGGAVSVVIAYPGGDTGRAWAGEVYNWLVAFGVPTRHLELQAGSGAGDRLVIAVIDRS